MANKKPASQAVATDALRPTSDLPFAARVCDVPYLEALENWRYKVVEKMVEPSDGQFDRVVDFAQNMARFAQRMSEMQDLLAAVEDCMKQARYGGGPSAASPGAMFMRGVTLLGLARELVESAVIDADGATEEFCTPEASSS